MIAEGVATPELKSLVFDGMEDVFFKKDAEGLNLGGWEVMTEIIARLYKIPLEKRARFVDTAKMELRYAALSTEAKTYKVKTGFLRSRTVKVDAPEAEHSGDESIEKKIVRSLVERLIPRPALGDSDSHAGAKDTFEDERLVAREDRIVRSLWQEAGLRLYNLSPTLLVKPPMFAKLKALMRKDVGENGEVLEADLKALDRNIERNQVLSTMNFARAREVVLDDGKVHHDRLRDESLGFSFDDGTRESRQHSSHELRRSRREVVADAAEV
jgi:hypothetical protein